METLRAIHTTKEKIDSILTHPNHDLIDEHATPKIISHKPAFRDIDPQTTLFSGINAEAPYMQFQDLSHEEHKLAAIFSKIATPFFGENQDISILHHHGTRPETQHKDGHQTLVIPTRDDDRHTLHTKGEQEFEFPSGHLACLGKDFWHQAPAEPRHIIRAIPVTWNVPEYV